ncbi:DNA translocase FtsK 4TM domain-containing protein, partial [bacterium]|nr:DNA translocase FtsK 4TM domain-containing protein [bacterium]
MSGRNRKKAKRKNGRSWSDAPWLSGLLLIAVALYMGLSLTGPVGPWWSVMEGEATPDLLAAPNPGGPVGAVLDVALHALFGGLWCWTFPLVVAVLGLGYLTGAQARLRPVLLRALPLWLVSAAWLAQPDGPLPGETAIRFGGVAGFGLARAFHGLFGLWGGRIFLTLALLVTLILIFKRWLRWLPGLLGGVGAGLAWLAAGVRDVVTWPVA